MANPHRIAGTGSRSLVTDERMGAVKDEVLEILTIAKKAHGQHLEVVSGMAEGFDELIAMCATHLKIPWIAVVPHDGYGVYYWGDSLLGHDRYPEFVKLLGCAKSVEYVCNSPLGGRSNFIRNERMVEMAHEFLVWGNTRGTKHCRKLIERAGLPWREVTGNGQSRLL